MRRMMDESPAAEGRGGLGDPTDTTPPVGERSLLFSVLSIDPEVRPSAGRRARSPQQDALPTLQRCFSKLVTTCRAPASLPCSLSFYPLVVQVACPVSCSGTRALP